MNAATATDFCAASDIMMIFRELLSRHDYLRLRRHALGLPRASRAQLCAAYDEYTSLRACYSVHGAPHSWHKAYGGHGMTEWIRDYNAGR